MSPVWGVSFWNGKFAFGSGEFVIGVGIFLLVWAIVVVSFGVGRIRRRHFGVGNSHSGVGHLLLVWAIALGVGRISRSPSAVLRETRTRHLGRSRQPASRWTKIAKSLEWGVFFR